MFITTHGSVFDPAVGAAVAELRACAGTQFDPRVAEVLGEIAQA